MDLRFVAVVMVIAIIMDMLGRMAKKRAAEQQGPPGEEWDMLKALAEGQEPPGPAAGEARPARREQQVAGGFELWSETPAMPGARDSVEREPVVEPAAPEPAIRDRAARPIVVHSREPRPVEQRWELPEPHPVPPEDPPSRLVVAQPATVKPPAVRPPIAVPPVTGAASAGRRTRRTRAAPQLEGRLGLGTIDGLRKALVAREVLGPPVALRGEEGERKRR